MKKHKAYINTKKGKIEVPISEERAKALIRIKKIFKEQENKLKL